MGDFNHDLLPGQISSDAWSLRHSAHQNGFQQLVKGATHSAITRSGLSYSLIDHIYINNSNLYQYSDHFLAFGSMHDFVFCSRQKLRNVAPPVEIIFRSLRNVDWDAFKAQIPSADDHDLHSYNNEILRLLDLNAPLRSKLIKGIQKPWYTLSIHDLALKRDSTKRKSNKAGSLPDDKMFRSRRNRVNTKKLF